MADRLFFLPDFLLPALPPRCWSQRSCGCHPGSLGNTSTKRAWNARLPAPPPTVLTASPAPPVTCRCLNDLVGMLSSVRGFLPSGMFYNRREHCQNRSTLFGFRLCIGIDSSRQMPVDFRFPCYQSTLLAKEFPTPSLPQLQTESLGTHHSPSACMQPLAVGGDPVTPVPHYWLLVSNSPDEVAGMSHPPASSQHPCGLNDRHFLADGPPLGSRGAEEGHLPPTLGLSMGCAPGSYSQFQLTGRMLHPRLPPFFLLFIFCGTEII